MVPFPDPSATHGTAFYVRLPVMGWTLGSRLWVPAQTERSRFARPSGCRVP